MPSRYRPTLVTFVAVVNLLAGLLGGAAVAASAYVNFNQFVSPPKSPPPEPAINPQQGAPGMGVAGLPPPNQRPQIIIARPSLLTEHPAGYFQERQKYLIRQ